MILKHRTLLLCGLCIGAVTGVVIAIANSASPTLAIPVTPATLQSGITQDLVQGNNGTSLAFKSDVKSCTIWWSARGMYTRIKRNERETPSSTWYSQTQELSASFHIIDSRTRHDQELYVAGLYTTGESTIEQWTFTHPPKYSAAGAYIPISQRRLPTVRRSVLYRGTSLGAIRSLEPDPQGRFLMILSHSPRALYKMSLQSPFPTETLHTTASLPALSSIVTVHYAVHLVEGIKFVLTKKLRWQHSADGPFDTNQFVVFLNDPNDDGIFDAPITVDTISWVNYKSMSNWLLWASVGP